jgi:hypothetical protein
MLPLLLLLAIAAKSNALAHEPAPTDIELTASVPDPELEYS